MADRATVLSFATSGNSVSSSSSSSSSPSKSRSKVSSRSSAKPRVSLGLGRLICVFSSLTACMASSSPPIIVSSCFSNCQSSSSPKSITSGATNDLVGVDIVSVLERIGEGFVIEVWRSVGLPLEGLCSANIVLNQASSFLGAVFCSEIFISGLFETVVFKGGMLFVESVELTVCA